MLQIRSGDSFFKPVTVIMSLKPPSKYIYYAPYNNVKEHKILFKLYKNVFMNSYF